MLRLPPKNRLITIAIRQSSGNVKGFGTTSGRNLNDSFLSQGNLKASRCRLDERFLRCLVMPRKAETEFGTCHAVVVQGSADPVAEASGRVIAKLAFNLARTTTTIIFRGRGVLKYYTRTPSLQLFIDLALNNSPPPPESHKNRSTRVA